MSPESPLDVVHEQINRLISEKRWVELVQVDWILRKGPLDFLRKLLAWFEKHKDTLSPQDYSNSVSSLRNAIALRESQNSRLRLAGMLFDRAKQDQKEGRFAEAIAILTELIALDPNNADFYRERGLARKRNGEYWVNYSDDLYRAVEIEPGDVDNQIAVIDLEFCSLCNDDGGLDYDLWRDVIARCNTALEGGEDDQTEGRIFRRRSEANFLHADNDNPDEYDRLMASSLADIDKAIDLEPQCAEYYLARERILSSLRKPPDRAALISCLSKAIECDPSCWEAYKLRCEYNLLDNQLREADDDLAKATELYAKAGGRSIRLGDERASPLVRESLERLEHDIMAAVIEQLKRSESARHVISNANRPLSGQPNLSAMEAKVTSPTPQHLHARPVKTSPWPGDDVTSNRQLFSGDGPCPKCGSILWIDWKYGYDTMACPACQHDFDGEVALSVVFQHEPEKNVGSVEKLQQAIKLKAAYLKMAQTVAQHQPTPPHSSARTSSHSASTQWWDCPWCGKTFKDDTYDPSETVVCNECDCRFQTRQAINLRSTEERKETKGLLGRMWSGSSIKKPRRQFLIDMISKYETLIRLSVNPMTGGDVQSLQRAQLMQMKIAEMKQELRDNGG